jgi:hypothetical protein
MTQLDDLAGREDAFQEKSVSFPEIPDSTRFSSGDATVTGCLNGLDLKKTEGRRRAQNAFFQTTGSLFLLTCAWGWFE